MLETAAEGKCLKQETAFELANLELELSNFANMKFEVRNWRFL